MCSDFGGFRRGPDSSAKRNSKGSGSRVTKKKKKLVAALAHVQLTYYSKWADFTPPLAKLVRLATPFT